MFRNFVLTQSIDKININRDFELCSALNLRPLHSLIFPINQFDLFIWRKVSI